MPSNLLLNTRNTTGYNNSLKKVSSDMKLGVNKSVNLEIKSVRVRHMHGSSSKINRPRSEGSRPERAPLKPLAKSRSGTFQTINKTLTRVQVKIKSSKKYETNHDMVKGRFDFGWTDINVLDRSTTNMATNIIRRHSF